MPIKLQARPKEAVETNPTSIWWTTTEAWARSCLKLWPRTQSKAMEAREESNFRPTTAAKASRAAICRINSRRRMDGWFRTIFQDKISCKVASTETTAKDLITSLHSEVKTENWPQVRWTSVSRPIQAWPKMPILTLAETILMSRLANNRKSIQGPTLLRTLLLMKRTVRRASRRRRELAQH